eukprot:5098343-Lingulodinium_polyedra.AAC.2
MGSMVTLRWLLAWSQRVHERANRPLPAPRPGIRILQRWRGIWARLIALAIFVRIVLHLFVNHGHILYLYERKAGHLAVRGRRIAIATKKAPGPTCKPDHVRHLR